jgi:glycosyltransferase involved in cell wall biosynthesis
MQPLGTKVKILNVSTHNEPCGIGKYQESFVRSLNNQALAYASFFDISPNIFKNQPETEKQASLALLETSLKDYDVLHIQHEFSFFNGNDLERIVNLAHSIGKKVVITAHTPPSLAWTKPSPPRITGLSTLLANRAANKEIKTFHQNFVAPLSAADCIICPNPFVAAELVSLGISAALIKNLPHPIPCASASSSSSTRIGSQLRQSDDDIILATIGFVAETKGIHHVIDALSFLPNNFKLAVIGGLHPAHGYRTDYLQNLLDLVIRRNLQSRFYITGYIENDDELFHAVSECDICLFPYDLSCYRAISSASINIATSSHKPAIAFPTPAFKYISSHNKSVQICKLANGYELARTVKDMNIEAMSKEAELYSRHNSYDAVAANLARIYSELTSKHD